jgi:hypothetical protein
VRRWSHRNNWWERRERIRQKAAQRSDDERAEKLTQLIKQFEDLQQATFHSSSEHKYRSKEGVVRSLATLQRTIDGLNKREEGIPSREALDDIVDVIFDLLGEDEEVGPVLAKRQALIGERIDEKLLREKPGISGHSG